MHLKLGTRKSALALAQSQWVADQLEALSNDITAELIGIETQADESRGGVYATKPLSQLDGKNFFIKELDDALLSGITHLSVHSLKDLSLERPDAIELAAIPKREDARDVVILSAKGKAKLRAGKALSLGTSSPRRIENIPPLLRAEFGSHIEVKEIRGNITTRIGRLHDLGKRYLDGVALALAGIKRLYASEQYRNQLTPKLAGVFFLPLPLASNPTAPGQGALAIECLKENQDILLTLQRLHSLSAAEDIAKERAILAKYGGGCHQAFGASRIRGGKAGEYALYIRGRTESGQILDEVHGSLQATEDSLQIFDSLQALMSS